jgi:hypothetical protein
MFWYGLVVGLSAGLIVGGPIGAMMLMLCSMERDEA